MRRRKAACRQTWAVVCVSPVSWFLSTQVQHSPCQQTDCCREKVKRWNEPRPAAVAVVAAASAKRAAPALALRLFVGSVTARNDGIELADPSCSVLDKKEAIARGCSAVGSPDERQTHANTAILGALIVATPRNAVVVGSAIESTFSSIVSVVSK